MSFDARSRERLEALGRRLPTRLPVPEPAAAPGPTEPERGAGRHRVETESNPEQLFRELMQASADGTVPPHLLDRLRSLEAPRRGRPRTDGPGSPPSPPEPASRNRSGPVGTARRPAVGQRPGGSLPRPVSEEEQQLYTEFSSLLLEDEEDR